MPEIGDLQSVAAVRLIDLLGEGKIRGLVDGLKSVWLEDTPVQNADNSFNFPEFEIELLKGADGQQFSRGLVYLENEPTFVDTPVETQLPITRTVTDTQVDVARIILSFAALFVQDTKEGDTDGLHKTVRIEYTDADNQNYMPVNEEIYGEELGPFEVQFEFELSGPGPWQITVSRISDDDATPYEHSSFRWSRLVEIIREKFAFDGSAVAALYFNMKTFGGKIPRRKYELYGLKLLIPTNYDPETRDTDGIWDGTFKEEYTDNNAWVAYNLLANDKYGMGIPNFVDKWSFYAAAAWCDETISNGAGGTEARYTFNGVLENEEEGLVAAQAVASSFRGNIAWTGSKFIVSVDKPGPVMKVVSPSDVIDGDFFTQGDPASGVCSVCIVTFTDPETGEPDIVVEEDDDLIDKLGYREIKLYALGCNKRSRAKRLAKWYLETVKNETEIVTYRAGFNNIDVIPGMIVAIADPATSVVRNGGRVKSCPTTKQVVLDRQVPLDQPTKFYFTTPDGEVQKRDANVTGALTATVTFEEALPQKLLPDASWALETAEVKLRQVRVINVKEVSLGIFEVTGLTHDPNKFARVEQGKVIAPPNYTAGQTIRAPDSLEIGRYYRAGTAGKVESAVYAFWEKGDERVIKFDVEALSGTAWSYRGTPRGQSFTFTDNSFAFESVRVRGIDVLGRPSAYRVKNITLNSRSLGIVMREVEPRGKRRITWNYVTDIRLNAIVQLYLNGNLYRIVPATPQEIEVDFPLTGSQQLQILAVPGVSGTYMVAPLTAIVGLAVNYTRAYRQGVPYVDPVLTWNAKANAVYYEVWSRRDSGTWVLLNIQNALSYVLPSLAGEEANTKWQYAVVAVALDGSRSQPQDDTVINFLPGFDDIPPNPPTGLMLEETAEHLRRLYWTVDTSPAIAGYEIRALIGSTTDWDTGIELHTDYVRMSPFELRAVPPYTTAIAIRALDYSGNASIPAYVTISIGERPTENIVVETNAHPTFPGTVVKGTVTGGVLIGPNNTPQMYNAVTSTLMWKADSSVAMWASGAYQNYDYSQAFVLPKGIFSIRAAFTGPALFDYKIGSGAYVQYTSPVQIAASTVTVRAYGPAAAVTEMKLTQLTIIVDVEDVTEVVNNMTIAAGGTRVPKTKTYSVIQEVTTTLVEQVPAVRVEVVDRNATSGPLLKVRRISDNVDVGGVAQSVALKGYA